MIESDKDKFESEYHTQSKCFDYSLIDQSKGKKGIKNRPL